MNDCVITLERVQLVHKTKMYNSFLEHTCHQLFEEEMEILQSKQH